MKKRVQHRATRHRHSRLWWLKHFRKHHMKFTYFLIALCAVGAIFGFVEIGHIFAGLFIEGSLKGISDVLPAADVE